ncbi:uncharacterized protein MONBRDRAFT_32228 [Monosiga brevicollis MX1]|uniref:HpcH/HpaI aldolase/citrate lyase domain-containing protein n=1 Tax=Monosiga brevicollis TaxID=81824 RepID=A9UXK4_MONBE|nr:uncharacterized protein MONBRDRAFT_32228 [Monosiga brevicollis MX1]EDQ90026.1 predicted protein [Monosiga brevicollis MX1]|eukprot:XP_001745448.1 hypothetical protein [Monosiga brevicollis MX1]
MLGTVVTSSCPLVARQLGRTGLRLAMVDLQHGLLDMRGLLPMLGALREVENVWVRCPSGEDAVVGRILDHGVRTVVLPAVNTARQVENFVRAATYPPRGHRSFQGMTFAVGYEGNEAVRPVAMIETSAALDNLDAICQVPGLHGLLVGPYDLARSLGITPDVTYSHVAMQEVLDQVVTTAQQSGLQVAAWAGSEMAATALLERGLNAVLVGTDMQYLQDAIAQSALVSGLSRRSIQAPVPPRSEPLATGMSADIFGMASDDLGSAQAQHTPTAPTHPWEAAGTPSLFEAQQPDADLDITNVADMREAYRRNPALLKDMGRAWAEAIDAFDNYELPSRNGER